MHTIDVLGMDYGASNGRGIVGSFDGRRLLLKEIHRFPNYCLPVFDHYYWDVLFLYQQSITSIQNAMYAGYKLQSMAFDSWALDFGLINQNGRLLDGVHAYRDSRTCGLGSDIRKQLPDQEFFQITGLPSTDISTLCQLLAFQRQDPELLEQTDRLLFVAGLLAWMLTGQESCDATIASTSMLYDLLQQTWSKKIMNHFRLPPILPPILPHGSIIGTINNKIVEQEHVEPIPVIAVASHDTASAFSSVPARNKDEVITISCGTWSVIGTTVSSAKIDDRARYKGFCYETGYQGQLFLARNLTGLFIFQECIREWQLEGYAVDYKHMEDQARCSDFPTIIDVTDAVFALPGQMNEKINAYCHANGYKPPGSKEEVYQCIVRSLVHQYEKTIGELEQLTGRSYERIHIIGGGARDRYLCESLAQKAKKEVIAGPYEATVIGNICAQLAAHGAVTGMSDFVGVVEDSFTLDVYR